MSRKWEEAKAARQPRTVTYLRVNNRGWRRRGRPETCACAARCASRPPPLHLATAFLFCDVTIIVLDFKKLHAIGNSLHYFPITLNSHHWDYIEFVYINKSMISSFVFYHLNKFLFFYIFNYSIRMPWYFQRMLIWFLISGVHVFIDIGMKIKSRSE